MKTLNMQVPDYSNYRKWDLINVNSTSNKGIIIKALPFLGSITLTVYPYKSPKNRFLRVLKFKWLKLRVWLKIIK